MVLASKEGVTRRNVEALVKLHLVALDAFLKQKDGLTIGEIELITDEVMNRYGWVFTIADIYVIFRNAKLGRYGELYNKLTAAQVMGWFESYNVERNNSSIATGADPDYNFDGSRAGGVTAKELGYTIDNEGRIVVSQERQETKKKPMRYIYGSDGKIKRENPAYWAKVKNKKNGEDELAKVNRFNRVLSKAKELMDADMTLSYPMAIEQAAKEEDEQQKNQQQDK